MTTKTRYFVIASLLTLGVGLGTGLVAYYVGFPAGAVGRRGGPEELEYVPRDATVIAFANVHEVMTSELRQKIRHAVPLKEDGRQELERETGINIETDIDRVVACVNPDPGGTNMPGAGMVLVAAFTLRALKRAFFDTDVEDDLTKGRSIASPNPPALEPITLPEKLGASLLMFTTLAIGLYPKLLLDRIVPAVEAMRFLKS